MHAEEQLKAPFRDLTSIKAVCEEHAFFSATDLTGKIIAVSDKFCIASKFSREELIGSDHRITNSGFHPREFMRQLWSALKKGEVWEGEIKNRAKDGTFYWVEATIQVSLDDEGVPLHYVAVYVDITRRKQAEESVEKLQAALAQQAKEHTLQVAQIVQELETFSYSVSHDLRAPLRAVNGFSQALADEFSAKLSAQGKHYVDTICNSAKQMGELIDGLQTFTQFSHQSLSPRAVDTARLVQEALFELGAPFNDRSVEIQLNPLPFSFGDPALLKQLWKNLLSNALKYLRRQGKPKVEVGVTMIDGTETFFVKDNGVGFDMHYAGKLFGIFQRMHPREDYDGAGVGLAVCQRIVHRHAGRIWAQAQIDHGATFYFILGEKFT